jgi:hypothetical protein
MISDRGNREEMEVQADPNKTQDKDEHIRELEKNGIEVRYDKNGQGDYNDEDFNKLESKRFWGIFDEIVTAKNDLWNDKQLSKEEKLVKSKVISFEFQKKKEDLGKQERKETKHAGSDDKEGERTGQD